MFLHIVQMTIRLANSGYSFIPGRLRFCPEVDDDDVEDETDDEGKSQEDSWIIYWLLTGLTCGPILLIIFIGKSHLSNLSVFPNSKV